MVTVNTYQELRESLNGDGQGSGTKQGWVIFKGQKLFVRKHWSYEGGYPVYTDESSSTSIGELKKSGEAFPYTINGEPQYKNNYTGTPLYNFNLVLSNEN